MQNSAGILTLYDGTEMKSKRKVSLQFKEIDKKVEFEVLGTEKRQRPLIGVESCLELGLLKMAEQVNAISHEINKEWLNQEYDDILA